MHRWLSSPPNPQHRETKIKVPEKAFDFFERHQIDTEHMIHHSNRGGQYASSSCTELLCQRECLISMIQTDAPLHNALTERTTGTIKNSWYASDPELSFEEASRAVDRAVERYNALHPHQVLGMCAPLNPLEDNRQPTAQVLPPPPQA